MYVHNYTQFMRLDNTINDATEHWYDLGEGIVTTNDPHERLALMRQRDDTLMYSREAHRALAAWVERNEARPDPIEDSTARDDLDNPF